jgi:HSP20 family protein
MTLVKFKNRPFEKNFNNLFEDFFEGIPTFLNEGNNLTTADRLAPVNIVEKDDHFQLELVAPGFDKTDFQIKIENNLLTISMEKEKEHKEETKSFIRKEYSYKTFSRSFTLDENIDESKIDANYNNGVLHLMLPKKPEVKAATKQITVK